MKSRRVDMYVKEDRPPLPVEQIEKAIKAQECAQLIILRMPRHELQEALSGVLGKSVGPDVVERFLEMLNVARVALKTLDREGVGKVREFGNVS